MSCKSNNCTGCGCAHAKGEIMYMYRNKKGRSMFTEFVQKGENIIWVGKDEKSIHPIQTETDRLFFLNEMKQYDK